MRWRVFAFVSLGVNLALAAWLVAPHTSNKSAGQTGWSQVPSGSGKTNIVWRRQFFSWQEVESPDYPTYIANLRDIGCPEQTIRDIIIADVNSLYAKRRATELVTPEQQWWRSEADTNVVAAALEKARALEDERRSLLARLLGPAWESGDLVNLPRPTRVGVALDGPVLGSLSLEVKQSLEDISARSQERMQAYLDSQRLAGKASDPVELARLRQQTRDELARVLSPPQLEEFLLRYSQYANNLRSDFGQLRFFNASPDEFRTIFRDTDSLDQRIELLANSTDPNSVQARKALEDQREAIIKQDLGAKRYEEYRNLHDPLYRDAMATAIDAGTPEAASTIYQINVAALSHQDAITNSNLTASQKAIEMKRLELEQLQANTLATGQDLPPEPPTIPQTPKRVYTIIPGDTVAVVSALYGVPISAIREANPGVDFTKLQPGDSIFVPKSTMTVPGGP